MGEGNGLIDLEAGIEARPIPPIEANTVRIPAGVLTFGVEYRHLDTATAVASMRAEQDQGRMHQLDLDTVEVETTEGVTIHVFETARGGEFLRFDCFATEPHYHYLDPTVPWVNRHSFDTLANGDPLDWALDRLRTRLLPMLGRTTTGTELAQGVDLRIVAKALDEVERVARSKADAPSLV